MRIKYRSRLLLMMGALATSQFISKITYAVEKTRPNFIIFYTDDQGYGDSSVSMQKDRPELEFPRIRAAQASRPGTLG